MRAASLLAVILVCASGGCAADSTEHLEDEPCPADSELSYESFGGAFLDSYCQRCHGEASEDRNGAPASITFDDLDDVHDHMDRIFARAAGDNTSMPPGPDDPPAEERAMLAEWLACGAP